MAHGKFSLNLSIRSAWFRHPGVSDDVDKVEALSRVALKHVGDEILKAFGEVVLTLGLGMILPEQVSTVSDQ